MRGVARCRAWAFGPVLALALGAAGPAAAEPAWHFEHPAPPPGASFPVPLGKPGDLQFFAPNRGLLAVSGTAAVPKGLYVFDGVDWRQLATVCGGDGARTRIAWAAPTEFWTIADPAPAGRPSSDQGVTLCRFSGGQVTASYAVPAESADPYLPMNAATCRAPDDCWFGGVAGRSPDGTRAGAFHLHWDGRELQTVYAPQGRGVSDLETFDGAVFESSLLGGRARSADPAILAEPEAEPRLLRRIAGASFQSDPFVPTRAPADPVDATELLALDGDGSNLWAVGGAAASGPRVGGPFQRGPIAARLEAGAFREVPLSATAFAGDERFVDVAALPGSDRAWVAVEPVQGGAVEPSATVARIAPDGTIEARVRLPETGAPRGTAARIACPGTNECWLATSEGWLFHYTDGTVHPRDADPAFASRISSRPPDGRTPQDAPFGAPVDDSRRFAPPPIEIEPEAPPAETPGGTLAPLMTGVRTRVVRRTTLVVSFRLVRRARVGLVASRRGRVVGRVRARTLTPGRRSLRLRLDRRRWPTRLRFTVRELEQGAAEAPSPDGDIVTTGVRRDAGGASR